MSAAGSILRRRIAKKILDNIRWGDILDEINGAEWMKGLTIISIEPQPVTDSLTQVRVKTQNHGNIYLNVKVSEMN